MKEAWKYFQDLEGNLEKISKELEKLKAESKFSVQKVGMVRFNPFSGVGSDQSFSIALLDANNDGFVITSLYTREENRIYAKPLKAGHSEYLLSAEEKEAIEKANTPKKPWKIPKLKFNYFGFLF